MIMNIFKKLILFITIILTTIFLSCFFNIFNDILSTSGQIGIFYEVLSTENYPLISFEDISNIVNDKVIFLDKTYRLETLNNNQFSGQINDSINLKKNIISCGFVNVAPGANPTDNRAAIWNNTKLYYTYLDKQSFFKQVVKFNNSLIFNMKVDSVSNEILFINKKTILLNSNFELKKMKVLNSNLYLLGSYNSGTRYAAYYKVKKLSNLKEVLLHPPIQIEYDNLSAITDVLITNNGIFFSGFINIASQNYSLIWNKEKINLTGKGKKFIIIANKRYLLIDETNDDDIKLFDLSTNNYISINSFPSSASLLDSKSINDKFFYITQESNKKLHIINNKFNLSNSKFIDIDSGYNIQPIGFIQNSN